MLAGFFACFAVVPRLMAALVAGLLLTSVANAEITVTDIAGRVVTLEKPASRLMIDDGRYLIALSLIADDPVSLIAAWPKDINRIGPDTYRQYRQKFPAIEDLHQVASNSQQFSIEQILTAEPDAAIFSLTSRPTDGEIALIEQAGIPVVVIDFFDDPLDNIEPSLKILGAVTGKGEKAEAFLDFRRQRMEEIAGRIASAKSRPSVFLEPHAARTKDCCASPGKGNTGKYIEFAGGDNIGAGVIAGATGVLNLEYVIEANPNVYIATGGPHLEGTQGMLIGPGYSRQTVEETLGRVVSRPGIATLKAVRDGRVHGIAHQLLNSPLDILTVQALAKWIHPELFADIDLDATRRELNERFLAVPVEGINWATLHELKQ